MKQIRIIRVLTIATAMVLTAKLGRISYNGHIETWYSLPMDHVIERTDEILQTSGQYYVREDGVKMYGPWVIVAADESITRYTFIDTSLGKGIVLDTHTTGDPNLYDIATDWR